MPGEYEKDLRIDIYKLDDEFIRQPGLYLYYGEMAADAKLALDNAKDQLERVRSRKDLFIREHPERFGVEDPKKLREGMVCALVIEDSEFQEAQAAYNRALRNFSVLNTAKEAFAQRKTSLEYLARLWLGGYWSTVRSTEAQLQDGDTARARAKQAEGLESNPRLSQRKRRPIDDSA